MGKETSKRNNFFDEQAEQSEVKTRIVTSYLLLWAKVMTGAANRYGGGNKLAYVDLFAGPGRYEDGTVSTPLKVIELAASDAALCKCLVTIFNDADPKNTSKLKREIESFEAASRLAYPPKVKCSEVGDEIVKQFEALRLVPTLMFVDPWGYKGLSLQLINSVLKDWGCECVFFFNYNRINMGLGNDAVRIHMAALFGDERAARLSKALRGLAPEEREAMIVEHTCVALRELGGKYVLPFTFRTATGKRTSHHLVFVSKHPLGYKIMKEVMAGQSGSRIQGVASFDYNPATVRQPTLLEYARPLDDLAAMLLGDFAGRTVTMGKVYEEHNYGRPFIERNYKEVLVHLEEEGRITGDPPHHKRPKRNGVRTCANRVQFTFPAAPPLTGDRS